MAALGCTQARIPFQSHGRWNTGLRGCGAVTLPVLFQWSPALAGQEKATQRADEGVQVQQVGEEQHGTNIYVPNLNHNLALSSLCSRWGNIKKPKVHLILSQRSVQLLKLIQKNYKYKRIRLLGLLSRLHPTPPNFCSLNYTVNQKFCSQVTTFKLNGKSSMSQIIRLSF